MKRLLYPIILCLLLAAPAWGGTRLVSHKLNSENGLPDNNIRYIEQDSIGRMRFLSVYALYLYDGYNYRRLPHSEFLKVKENISNRQQGPTGYIYDNQGNMILTETGNDIIYIDQKSGERIKLTVFNDTLRQLTPSLKCKVITDRRGLIWVSVNGNGLFIYDRQTKKLAHITKEDRRRLIDSDHTIFMTEDRDGNIWVSQERYGVVCLTVEQTAYSVLDISNDKTTERNNEIRLMRRLSDGSIIICNNRGKLMRTDGNLNGLTNLNASKVQLAEGDNYNSVELDGHGRLWLGSQRRGVRIDGQWYGNGRVDCILKDSKNRMWTCSYDGHVKLAQLGENGNFYEKHFLTDIKGLRPRTMIQDSRGTVWVGADGGLFAFNPDELLKNPKAYRQLSDVPSRCLMEDSDHRLWIGTTERGLARLNDDGSLSTITRDDGLPNNVVQAIAENMHHEICIATEDGCARYNPKNNTIVSLYFPDNRVRNFYNADCALKLDDGRMAFGSLDGIVIVDKDVSMNLYQHHRSLVTDLIVNGVSVLDMREDSPTEGDISLATSITLNHNQNSLSIHFSNFDYSRNHMNGYIYMLSGYDKEWSKMANQNIAAYKNLKPGKYILLVKYRDELGWGDDEQVLAITINSPWWATWWAQLLFLLTGLAIGYVIYCQVRAVEKLHQRIALEKQMTDYKLRFFTNISHEFRTPLTLIQGAMEKISEQAKDVPGSIKQPLSNMQQSTNRMLRLVNQLLEFRRLQNNKLTLTLEETDIVKFVYDIFIGFHEVAESRSINYTFTPFSKTYKMYIDRGHVDKIVYNLLSNAFKYTPERENIAVNIREAEGKIAISISDSGIGVARDKQAELFDRFSTGRVSGDSIGIGLNLSKELAHAHHGDVTYQENEPKGSIFTLQLPTDKSIYQETDFMVTQTGLDQKPKERKGFTYSYREMKTQPLNNRRVLVAEDNMELGMMIKDELATYFEVDVVGNGMEALERLKNGKGEDDGGNMAYDLLVSDVMMPLLNGFELTRRIRADKTLAGLPIILLTALIGEEDRQKGLMSGADAYIEKPFSPKVLTAQAINLIEQRDRLRAAYAQQPKKAAVKELMHNDADRKFLLQLNAYIENHLGDYDLSVDKIAEHFEYGRTRFYNKVRNLTGMTPNDYIKDKRMTRAAELLRENSAITVAEVSYKVGINNTHYFAVSFKKTFGVTPSGYQRGEQPGGHTKDAIGSEAEP